MKREDQLLLVATTATLTGSVSPAKAITSVIIEELIRNMPPEAWDRVMLALWERLGVVIEHPIPTALLPVVSMLYNEQRYQDILKREHQKQIL